MTALSSNILAARPKQIRPFDMRRDLLPAADLIELCFAETLTIDGRHYLHSMRRAAQARGAAQWAALASQRSSFPLSGFIWEQHGEIIGNLSLIPFFHNRLRIYLIANVAVHPNHRRQGIAQALTQVALEKSRRRRAHQVWLQAREDNPSAVELYTKIGFQPQARRATWHAHAAALQGDIPTDGRVTIRSNRHWKKQSRWLETNYPSPLRWHFPLRMPALAPGLWRAFYRFFAEVEVRHWAALSKLQHRLLGVLTWQASRAHADHLWLAAPPETETKALQTLLPFIRQEPRLSRPLALDYPANRAAHALIEGGFEFQHTLIWMNINP